jgi:hypothetical protein
LIALHQQQPNFENSRPKTKETTAEITDRHLTDNMMRKPYQGNARETNCTQKTPRSLHHEQNITSNYKGTRASKERSHNTQTPQ